eukprot:7753915-Pyramimonas_sp.AAC.1
MQSLVGGLRTVSLPSSAQFNTINPLLLTAEAQLDLWNNNRAVLKQMLSSSSSTVATDMQSLGSLNTISPIAEAQRDLWNTNNRAVLKQMLSSSRSSTAMQSLGSLNRTARYSLPSSAQFNTISPIRAEAQRDLSLWNNNRAVLKQTLSSRSSTDMPSPRQSQPHRSTRFVAELGAVQHNQPNRRGATGLFAVVRVDNLIGPVTATNVIRLRVACLDEYHYKILV